MRLIVSLRVDIPANPEAETSLRWFLMYHLARADLARAIEQLLPPGVGCEVAVMGTAGLPKERKTRKGECYEYPKTGRLARWLRR
jgi:hypothetical protein